MQWFVYIDIDYYPYAEVIEAPDERAALEDARGMVNEEQAVVIAPLSAVTFDGPDWRWQHILNT